MQGIGKPKKVYIYIYIYTRQKRRDPFIQPFNIFVFTNGDH
jgi:hypothetical protein